MQTIVDREAAHRIIRLQHELSGRVSATTRSVLAAEQRSLWDELFNGRPFEAIERVAERV